MRRALGLSEHKAPAADQSPPPHSSTITQRPPRRFARDGDVPVTIIHRDPDDGSGVNRLEAAQRGLREQIAARERSEQQLRDAEATIRDLQTKLAHERLAKDEASGAMQKELAAVRQALETERAAREAAVIERDQAITDAREIEERLRTVMARRPVAAESSMAAVPVEQPRRRGRPPKVKPVVDESDVVEWWVPGWTEKYR